LLLIKSLWYVPRRVGVGVEEGRVGLVFEWDPAKAAANERKHGVSFDEALTISARLATKIERQQYEEEI